MPQVNLSALSGPDLRRLLDATRGRGDAALSYQILQEMADRRERPGRRGPFMTRRPAESRVIAMDLGDPTAREEEDDLPPMPHWRPPSSEASAASPPEPGPAQRRPRRRKAQAAPVEAAAEVPVEPVAPAEAEPAPHPPQELRPLSLRDADRETPPDAAAGPPDWDLRFQPPEPQGPRAPRRRGGGLAAGFAVGAAVGVTLGWGLWGSAHEAPRPPAAPAAALRTAALAPAPEPVPAPAALTVAVAEPAPEAPHDPVVALLAPDVAAPPPPPAAAEAPEAARDASGVALELPSPPPARANPEPVKTAEAPRVETPRADPCTREPTPADRAVCGDPELRGLQRELRQAYSAALEAHEDRALLRQRQLAWASARDPVSDPQRLAQLYGQRIRKLNAATAEARRQR